MTRRVEITDLVQKDGSFVRHLKASDTVGGSIRKSSFLMAEHFTFEQTLGDSSQVHFDKRLFGTLAVDVYRLGYQFLARPTFSGDQYGSIRLCYTGNGVQYFRQSLIRPMI